MNEISYDEFKQTADYSNFITQNSKTGTLKVMAFTAQQAIPIKNTDIKISKIIGKNKVVFFEGLTNSSGIIDNITLPTSPSDYNEETFSPPNSTSYDLIATHRNHKALKDYTIGMFENTKIIQYVKLTPKINMEVMNNGSN